MRTTAPHSTLTACFAAVLLSTGAAGAAAAVTPPPIDGVVLGDVSQPYVFDRIGTDMETGPFVDEDFYQGTVRTLAVRAPDATIDFYFHIKPSAGRLAGFAVHWQVPTSYTVAHHLTDLEMLWEPDGMSHPAPGTSFTDAMAAGAHWRQDETAGGALGEGWLVLDTDATAFAANATFQVADSLSRIAGNYHGQSAMLPTLGPAIPEPGTWALMLAGLGLFTLSRLRERAGVRASRPET